uniref:Immunoglobulin domain-containing protein n=1 Tax=Seriola dumerili TaxID=41447 RepID=A0A3B4V927_SERDU
MFEYSSKRHVEISFCIFQDPLRIYVKQFKDEVMGSEGDTVTLSCNYSVSSLHNFSSQIIQRNTPGLSLQHDKKTKEFHLNILSAAVTDSAVYYCALRPTVTGNTKTLYKNLWSKDNTILHNIH